MSVVLLSMKLTTFFDVQKLASGKSRNFKYLIIVHLLYGYCTPRSIIPWLLDTKIRHHSELN